MAKVKKSLFCGSEGQVQHECDIKAMIDHMKDLKFQLQEKAWCFRLCSCCWWNSWKGATQRGGKYVEWDSNITTCILDVDSYSFCANDCQPVENTTKQVKWNSHVIQFVWSNITWLNHPHNNKHFGTSI
jgi:hypothetical protein